MKKMIAFFVCLIIIVSLSGCFTSKQQRQFNAEVDYIEKLGKLHDKGFITDEEFEFKKREILKLDLE